MAAVPVALVFGVIGVLVTGGGAGDLGWFKGRPAGTAVNEPAADRGDVRAPGAGASPGPTGPAKSPPPHIQPFAQQPGVVPHPSLPSPTAGVNIPEGTDGCDHAYGDRDVCVPWTFPAGVADKCAWLRERGFPPLKITGGRDRHALDRNGDGIACGPGD